MASQSVGELIWLSFRPMLRLVICVSAGFIITRADLLPPVAARGAGQIMLNIAFPSLFFSKIVPAFTPQNISNLVCILYQLFGLLMCLIILLFFWVPHRFRWGFLVAGSWGNYGDLPTAVIMSVTAAAPFNGTEDQNLAVAYIAAFILVFVITLFPMGGHYLIAKDFHGPEKEEDDVRRSLTEKLRENKMILGHLWRAAIAYAQEWRHPLTKQDVESPQIEDGEVQQVKPKEKTEKEEGQASSQTASSASRSENSSLERSSLPKTTSEHVSFDPEDLTVGPSETDFPSRMASPHSNPPSPTPIGIQSTRSSPDRVSPPQRFLHKTVAFLRTLLTMPTMSIVSAFIISVIPAVKGLFVLLPSSPKAPDGQPPLAFIMDTATFLGGASIPLGLICLGSALARLRIPRGEWRKLPIGAIVSLAVGRMVVQPAIGVVLVQGLTHVGVISVDDKVLRFVCIFFSCVPTATTQVFLTQVYSGTGSAEHLAAFLIAQYALMFISSTVLTAYTLHLLFG